MQGLELSESYFNQYGHPLINGPFHEYANRIAAGIAGAGSECFGLDDTISQDHDWGPGFSFWLTDQDYHEFGKLLQQAYSELPAAYNGCRPRKTSPGEEWRVGVTTIKAFFMRLTGSNTPPATNEDWLRLPEHGLAAAINGKIFIDPLGEFSLWRNQIGAYFPEDVRLKKIASRCISIGQSGQYNFIRSSSRKDIFASLYALTQFCNDLLSLVFLLNRAFAPFYKLRNRAARQLPLLGKEICDKVELLLATTETKKQIQLIEEACMSVINELQRQNLTDTSSDFLLDHAQPVHNRISDTALKARLTIVA